MEQKLVQRCKTKDDGDACKASYAFNFEYHASKVGYKPKTNILFWSLQPNSNSDFLKFCHRIGSIINKLIGLVYRTLKTILIFMLSHTIFVWIKLCSNKGLNCLLPLYFYHGVSFWEYIWWSFYGRKKQQYVGEC